MSRPRLVLVLDWLIVALAALAVFIDTTGGFYTEFAGIRISARQTDRAVLAALAVWLVRWRRRRRHSAAEWTPRLGRGPFATGSSTATPTPSRR